MLDQVRKLLGMVLGYCILSAAMLFAHCAHADRAVTWSAVLNLPVLSDLEARLARRFVEPVEVTMQGKGAQATNCIELLDLRAKGYGGEGDRGFALERDEGARCLALSLLRQARPAQVSYLAKFRLDASVIRRLPPTVATSFSSIEDDAARHAESEGKSLVRFQRGLKARKEGDVLVITADAWESRIVIYAQGDFDGDGVDDLLVAVGERATAGTFDSTKLLLMTRKHPEGMLHTIRQLQ